MESGFNWSSKQNEHIMILLRLQIKLLQIGYFVLISFQLQRKDSIGKKRKNKRQNTEHIDDLF